MNLDLFLIFGLCFVVLIVLMFFLVLVDSCLLRFVVFLVIIVVGCLVYVLMIKLMGYML